MNPPAAGTVTAAGAPRPDAGRAARHPTADRYTEPLLDAATEVELARGIEAGLYAQHLLDTRPDLPAGLAGEYRQLARSGERARERMIRANLGLVAHWTGRRLRAGAGGELEFDELFNEGVLGLVRAVAKFDYTLGLKFSTYASTWIRSRQQRAVWRSRAVRLPDHLEHTAAVLRRVRGELEAAGVSAPDPVQVAAHAGLDADKVTGLLSALRTPVHLDAPAVNGDGHAPLLELLTGRTTAVDGADGGDSTLWDRVQDAVATLPVRSQRVLRLRTGLDDDGPDGRPRGPLTQRQVAARLGVSPAGVAKVEAAALAQLRAALGTSRKVTPVRAGRPVAARAA